jgi:penicillin amidase
MTGQLPIRAQGDGGRPAGPGESVWTGVVGGSSLPRALNPSAGFLATSNNPVARGGAPFITRDWAAPFRAARLTRTLADTPKLDVAGAASLQLDLRSDAAAAVLAGIDSAIAVAGGPRGDASALRVLEQLKQWDRVIDGGDDVALYQTFEDWLWRRTFSDDFPEGLFRRFYQWAGGERFAGIYPILNDPSARWWDDIATVERRETRDDIFVLAAADAARDVAARAAGARAWDQVHAATFAHALGDGSRVLAWLFNRGPIPVAGDGTTLMRMSYRRLGGFAAWEHPSWRQVLDVGAWDNSRGVLPAGQSGHPLSPNYFDQNALWRNGQYRTLAFTRTAVDAAAAHRQIATP